MAQIHDEDEQQNDHIRAGLRFPGCVKFFRCAQEPGISGARDVQKGLLVKSLGFWAESFRHDGVMLDTTGIPGIFGNLPKPETWFSD